MKPIVLSFTLLVLVDSAVASPLRVVHDVAKGTISVFRVGAEKPILTQNARKDHRPYLHPIVAPDGKGLVTEYSPGHHKHQTGIYWGFTRVNGRDYFHHPEGTYWRRVEAEVLEDGGNKGQAKVTWKTVYDLLGKDGSTVLTETQLWSMEESDGEYILDLEWIGEAKTKVTVGKYDYGGLFLRMPWRKGIKGAVVNGARQRDRRAEGKRAPWVDVGMQVEGRDDLVHIAVLDHPKNKGFPMPWRVDGQMGVGPVRARMGDWHIEKGKQEVIRHRLHVYTGELNNNVVTDKWKRYSGQGGTYHLWGLAQREGRQAKFLTPKQAVENMTLQDGFEVNVYASEPMITQPMAFCWDDRGRMWIAENRDYETRGRGFSNSGDSRILILEDTDRDGVVDTRKVFAEGIPFPAGIAVGFDGLWLGAPPNLLFVPDRNGDDVADMDDIEVRLTGWGIRDRHETLNSFHWGPDGWLYGTQGFATPSRVGKPAGDGRLFKHKEAFPEKLKFRDEPVDINGGVWRYHPLEDRFEVVAHGFSNPWGIDYDAKGQLFITACVIPHLFHVIPGGIYHRQGGRHFNPYVYSDIRTITDHRHRSAHGGARVYLSDAFPEKYHGRLFMANIHEHAVLTDVLEKKGSGFVGRHGDDFLHANNAQWIGFSMEIGPEGAVYVLDWHDGDICGKDVLQKNTGRVFRMTPEKSLAKEWNGRYADISELDNTVLASLQRSDSAWHARRARVVLQNRASKGQIDAETHAALRAILANDANSDWRLRALWALHVSGGISEGELATLLKDRDEYVRAWSIQLLCEDMNPSEEVVGRLHSMARDEASPVVRLYLAAALQRVPEEARWGIASGLATHADDEGDHNIPKMIWFGIEGLVEKDPQRVLSVVRDSRLTLVTRQAARRMVDANQLELAVATLSSASPIEAPRVRDRQSFLRGIRDAFDGRRNVKPPKGWAEVYADLKTLSDGIPELALPLAQQFGDDEATAARLAILSDETAEPTARGEALRALASQQFPALQSRLVGLLGDKKIRREVIRAIAAYDDEGLGKALLQRYKTYDTDEKLEVVHTLASRSKYGWQLAQAIKRGDVPKKDVPAYIARQLRRVVGNGFVEIWGPIDALSDETKQALVKYRELLSDEALAKADASEGRALFKKTCLPCHKLYEEGGQVGPELTGANRGDLTYLLGNILTPSEIIQDDYRMLMVLTNRGRLYSGILAQENERQIGLRVAGQEKPVTVAKSSIASREIAKVSMMPEGLLRNLSDTEVLDLIAYLRTSEQVPLPAGK